MVTEVANLSAALTSQGGSDYTEKRVSFVAPRKAYKPPTEQSAREKARAVSLVAMKEDYLRRFFP